MESFKFCEDINVQKMSKSSFESLKRNFPMKSNDTLARYLIANNDDHIGAGKQLQRADAHGREYSGIKMSRCRAEIEKGSAYIHGCDKEGRPIIIVHARLHDPVNRNVKESVLMTLWWTEQAIARLPSNLSRFTILLDRDNCDNAADKEYMQELSKVFMDLHPERLHRAIVYPAGIVFYSMWNLIVKWFMAENTREKVIPAVSLSDVTEYIDVKYIPASLGGQSEYVFNIDDFEDPVALRGDDANSSGESGEGNGEEKYQQAGSGAHTERRPSCHSTDTTVESCDDVASHNEVKEGRPAPLQREPGVVLKGCQVDVGELSPISNENDNDTTTECASTVIPSSDKDKYRAMVYDADSDVDGGGVWKDVESDRKSEESDSDLSGLNSQQAAPPSTAASNTDTVHVRESHQYGDSVAVRASKPANTSTVGTNTDTDTTGGGCEEQDCWSDVESVEGQPEQENNHDSNNKSLNLTQKIQILASSSTVIVGSESANASTTSCTSGKGSGTHPMENVDEVEMKKKRNEKKNSRSGMFRNTFSSYTLSLIWCALVSGVVAVGLYGSYYPSTLVLNVSIPALAQLALSFLLIASFYIT